MAKNIGDTIGNLFAAMAIAEQRRKSKEQEFQDKIKLAREEAKIKQEFASPMDKLVDVATASKALMDAGIDPRGIFGTAEAGAELEIPEVPTAAPGQSAEPVTRGQGLNFRGMGRDIELEPTKFERTAFGGIQPTQFERKGAAMRKAEAGQIAQRKQKVAAGSRASISNLELITGVGRDFAQVLADAMEEGGAGGAFQAFISRRAERIGDLPKFLGGAEIGGKFPASGAVPGKRNEFLLKMMPMLTQQTEKPEGSVRLIRSVLAALGQTVPDKNTAARTAIRQLTETVRTFYRFARAAEENKMQFSREFTAEDINNLVDEQGRMSPRLANWVAKVARLADRVELSPEEEASVDKLSASVVEPISKRIESRKVQKPAIREGQTATNPNTGEKMIYRGGKWQMLNQ